MTQLESPVSPEEFDGLMAALNSVPSPDLAVAVSGGPDVAVAVSGGPDSLALVHLVKVWARDHGGRVMALTVDHRLRPQAAAEALRVGRWMRALEIPHRTLVWRGPKPQTGIQAAAREARYALLCGWCRDHGVRTLLVAHHRDDQAETFLMRLDRGSGPDGLAAMASQIIRDGVTIIRPLLAIPKSRLEATCRALGQDWIDDPSNRDPRFGRTHARAGLAALAAAGLDGEAIAAATRAFGRSRAARERAVSGLLDAAATEHSTGYIRLNWQILAAALAEVGSRALSRILCRVGGGHHGPRTGALSALYRAVAGGLVREQVGNFLTWA